MISRSAGVDDASCRGLSVGRVVAQLKLLAVFVVSPFALSSCAAVDVTSLPAPERATIPKLSGKVEMDGKLSEAVWAKAAVLRPFVLNDGSAPGREATEVRVWYDEEALYLAWICVDSDIQATFTERDSRFWEEEVVEFFITAKALDRYFELQWNPLGGVFDAIITNELGPDGVSKSFQGDWDFTAPGMTSAVKVEGSVGDGTDRDGSWQVEVRVPWVDLGSRAPRPGEMWRANCYRFNRGNGLEPELLSWSPTRLTGFHQPTRFGFFEFGE